MDLENVFGFRKGNGRLVKKKDGSIPIPDGQLNRDGDSMVSDAKQEQDALRQELRGILDELTYDKIAARNAEMGEALERQLAKMPLGIYVGFLNGFIRMTK